MTDGWKYTGGESSDTWSAELLAAGVPAGFIEKLRLFHTGKESTDPWRWFPVLLGTANRDLFQQDETVFSPFQFGGRVVPVFAESNNDAYILLVIRDDGERRFVRITNEGLDMDDYGPDFRLVVADLVLAAWEVEAEVADIERFADSVGFKECRQLLAELSRSDRSTFEEDAEWRRTVLPRIFRARAT